MASTLKNEKIKRQIHYYELNFEYHDDFDPKDGDKFRGLFEIIVALAKTKDHSRYQTFGEKAIFIQDIKFDGINKVVSGKLRCVRKDMLPELMNTKTDVARGIDADDNEGLVDTTHFIIDYSKSKKKLAIEFNQFGAKIMDFNQYILKIGIDNLALKSFGFTPVVKDELSKIKDKINRCSEFIVKIHRDNLEEIKDVDAGVYSALSDTMKHFSNDYATLFLKFDYREKINTDEMNNSIKNIIKSLIVKKETTFLFNRLTIRAENSENNNLLETFDLLMDKVSSEIKVEKKAKYRTLVSDDMFTKMKSELIKKKI